MKIFTPEILFGIALGWLLCSLVGAMSYRRFFAMEIVAPERYPFADTPERPFRKAKEFETVNAE